MGSSWFEFVVETRRPARRRATRPSSRMRRATRFALTGSPCACSSCCTRGAPYVAPLSWWAIRTWAINSSSTSACQLVWPLQRRVVARVRDLQHPTHESHSKLVAMTRDHGVPQRDSFAKYTATFLQRPALAAARDLTTEPAHFLLPTRLASPHRHRSHAVRLSPTPAAGRGARLTLDRPAFLLAFMNHLRPEVRASKASTKSGQLQTSATTHCTAAILALSFPTSESLRPIIRIRRCNAQLHPSLRSWYSRNRTWKLDAMHCTTSSETP